MLIIEKNKHSSKIVILLSNLSAKFYIATINFIFIPVYINKLGLEVWGVVSFFASITAISNIVEGSLSTLTIKESANKNVNALISIQKYYWKGSKFFFIGLLLLTPIWVFYWLKFKELSNIYIISYFIILSLTFFFQFPQSFYVSNLIGQQRNLQVNILSVFIWTLKIGGTLLILFIVKNGVSTVFFSWQLIIAILFLGLLKYLCRDTVKVTDSNILIEETINIKSHITHMVTISFIFMCYNQADKIIISYFYDVSTFGAYALAWQIIGAAQLIYAPIYTVYLAIFSKLTDNENEILLLQNFKESTQLLGYIILIISLTLFFYSEEIVNIWLNGTIATYEKDVADTLKAISISVFFNSIIYIPYCLSIAFHKEKIIIKGLLFFLILLLVSYALCIFFKGTSSDIGYLFTIVTGIQAIFISILVVKYLIPKVLKNWLIFDVLLPNFCAFIIFYILVIFQKNFINTPYKGLDIVFVIILSLLINCLFYKQLFLKIKTYAYYGFR